jgi:hypothetical protein
VLGVEHAFGELRPALVRRGDELHENGGALDDCFRQTANWIAEDLTDTLPDWGKLRFYSCHAVSDTGTIGTVSGPGWSYTPIDMVDGSGNLRAHVSSLNATGTSFTDTWDAS